MAHWAEQYIGRPWSDEQDCLYWYRRIKLEQFGRIVPGCDVDHSRLLRSAARIMTGNILEMFGYRPTAAPAEGDAVFLSQRRRPHHVGMVIRTGGGIRILHALEGVGVVVSDLPNLKLNGWTIGGYWTDAD